jgi:hypothetical protein
MQVRQNPLSQREFVRRLRRTRSKNGRRVSTLSFSFADSRFCIDRPKYLGHLPQGRAPRARRSKPGMNHMKSCLKYFVSAAMLLSPLAAHSADFAVKAPPAPVAAAVYNWTGLYIGVNGGWAGVIKTPSI